MESTTSQIIDIRSGNYWQVSNTTGSYSAYSPAYGPYHPAAEVIDDNALGGNYFILPTGNKALDNASSAKYPITKARQSTEIESSQELREYQVMKYRLNKLFSMAEEDYEESMGAIFPTAHAQTRAEELLYETARLMGNDFYRGTITTSFEGGVRIDWMRPTASVRLVIPAKSGSQEYIFFEDKSHYDTEQVTSENLVNRLIWLRWVLDNER